MVAAGIPAEDARYILPNATETKILVTMNARELLHFFELRCCERAQWEIRAMALEMLKLVKAVAPIIFRDAGPGCLTGPCPEGSLTCGKTKEVREYFRGMSRSMKRLKRHAAQETAANIRIKEVCMEKINIGGQAVIEGVMMRAPRSVAIAVRRASGEIVVKRDMVVPLSERFPVVKLPIVRGAVALFSSLIIGIKALNFSANEAMVEEKREKGQKKSYPLGPWPAPWQSLSVSASSSFSSSPFTLTKLLTQLAIISDNNIVFNLVDGVIRVAVFLLYIWSISRMKDIQRVFQYHGAEHKSIFAFEAGDELTVANVRGYSRLHPRCGTSFLLIVMLVSIVIFSLIPKLWPFYMKAGARVILLPLIAGVSYEFLKWSAKNDHSPLVKLIIAPGLALQRLTTREPDDSQLEVAIRSMQEALEMNAGYKDDRLVI